MKREKENETEDVITWTLQLLSNVFLSTIQGWLGPQVQYFVIVVSVECRALRWPYLDNRRIGRIPSHINVDIGCDPLEPAGTCAHRSVIHFRKDRNRWRLTFSLKKCSRSSSSLSFGFFAFGIRLFFLSHLVAIASLQHSFRVSLQTTFLVQEHPSIKFPTSTRQVMRTT